MKKRLIALILSGILLAFSVCGCTKVNVMTSEPAPSQNTPENFSEAPKEEFHGHDYLAKELRESALRSMEYGTDVLDYYSETDYTPDEIEFPKTYDLRAKGVISKVDNQYPWGTCWSFATIAACESSILATLGMTRDEYKEQYKEELNLSEKHLAFFANTALPKEEDYPEGEYPYDPSQAGEGSYCSEEYGLYDSGGNFPGAIMAFSSGIGVNFEKDFPYRNAEGKAEPDGDWSLKEEDRFGAEYVLKSANTLPSPVLYDADRRYSYNPVGTDSMKAELMKGRAVAAVFYADQSLPYVSQEAVDEAWEEYCKARPDIDKEDLRILFYVLNHLMDADSLTEEEIRHLLEIRIALYEYDSDTYDWDSLTPEETKKLLLTEDFSKPVDEILAAPDAHTYLNFAGEEENLIWAQYTYEVKDPNHVVTIVGWDDDFPKENFLQDHLPPEDGAWIVRNSWGSDWGMDGYFYLSYYDQNLLCAESFEFMTESEIYPEKGSTKKELYVPENEIVLGYDYMQPEVINSTLFTKPVLTSNVLEAKENLDLNSVSVMTGDLNSEVTVSIYRLKKNFLNPEDGELLLTVTDDFTFAGYHRIPLKENPHFDKGEKIGIVVKQSVMTKDGEKFALVNTSSIGPDGFDVFNEKHEELKDGRIIARYNIGIINPGESFVSYEDGEWHDWADEINKIKSEEENCKVISFDNFPVKAYAFSVEELEKQ